MVRMIAFLLAALLWAGSPLLAQERPRPETSAQWLALFDELLQQQRDGTEPERKPGVGYFSVDGAFSNACRANDASFEALRERYARLPLKHPAAAFQRCEAFQALVQLWFRQNLWQGVDIQWGGVPPVPEASKSLSPELAQAEQVYRVAPGPFLQTFGGVLKTGTLGFLAKEASFYAVLEDVLAGRGEHNAEKLAQYFNDDMVLPSIVPQMDQARRLAIWFTLVREKRYQEAVGAAVMAEMPLGNPGDPAPQIECIQSYGGLDWEKIFLGALLECERAPDKALIEGRRHVLELLVYRGSEKNIPLLLELCRLCTEENGRQDYLSALEAYLKPGKTGESYGRRDNSVKPASEALQREILARYSEIVLQGTPGETFNRMADALCRLRRPETREALRALTRKERFRREAALALAALGEKIDVPPEQGPVRFRLLMNGKPLCHTGAYAIVRYQRGAAVDENAKTDAKGVVALEPRMFQDFEAQPESISLRSWGQTTGIVREAVEPVFCVNLPVPQDRNAVTTLKIEASPLTLRLDPGKLPKRYEGKTATLFVQQMKENGQDVRVEWKFKRPYAKELTLQGLQHGCYRFVLLLPGAASVEASFTHPQKEPPLFELKPGAEVVYKASAPCMISLSRSDEQGNAVPVPLLSHLVFPPTTASGLPVGRYRYEFTPMEWTNPRLPLAPKRYQTTQVPFTIREDSPDVIDLGEIDLKSAQPK